MSKQIRKFSIGLVITCFAITFISLTCFITNVYAVNFDEQLKIEYEGTTKIISNIQNYLCNDIKTRSNSTEKANILLQNIGFSQDQISNLSEKTINNYLTANRIYSSVYSYVDSPLTYDDGYIEIIFTVVDKGTELYGRKTFLLSVNAYWKDSYPRARHRDVIAFAWTSGALTAGSAHSNHSMTYWKFKYNIFGGQSEGAEKITASSDTMWEQDQFPGYATVYDLPVDTWITTKYKGISMHSETKVTATEDFAAIASYGHHVVVGTPDVSVSTSGSSISLDFSGNTENYTPGIIRVYL